MTDSERLRVEAMCAIKAARYAVTNTCCVGATADERGRVLRALMRWERLLDNEESLERDAD